MSEPKEKRTKRELIEWRLVQSRRATDGMINDLKRAEKSVTLDKELNDDDYCRIKNTLRHYIKMAERTAARYEAKAKRELEELEEEPKQMTFAEKVATWFKG